MLTVPLGPLAADAPPPTITASAAPLASAQVTVARTDQSLLFSDGRGVELPNNVIAGRTIPVLWLIGLVAAAAAGLVLLIFVGRVEHEA